MVETERYQLSGEQLMDEIQPEAVLTAINVMTDAFQRVEASRV
jgi:hypothetical protein